MTGLAISSASLDPVPYVMDEAVTAPILTTLELNLEEATKRAVASTTKCECSDRGGFTARELCFDYMQHPNERLREVILCTPIKTRSDALACVRLLETWPDDEIAAHLLRMMHVWLSAA
jgi:hypothetical protein